MFFILVSLLCAVFGLRYWRKPRSISPPMLPGALPFIGHACKLMGSFKDLWEFEQNLFNFCLKNGGIVKIRFGPFPAYVLTDPDESLMMANICLDKPYFYNFAKDIYNGGLVTSTSSKWKLHRRLLNPAFNQLVINTFVAEFNNQARNLVTALDSEVGNESFNVHKYLIEVLLNTICKTSLGLKEQGTMINKDYSMATEHLNLVWIERIQKIWLHLPWIFNWSSLKSKQDQLVRKANSIIDMVIKNRKSKLRSNDNLQENTKPAQDKFKPLLDKMIELADKQDAFTDNEIREHLGTFVSAAYETTSSALTFAFILIGTHQEVQEKLFKELEAVIGHEDRDLTKDDLPKLVYLGAVLKESLRLYPAAPTIARHIHNDIKLRNYTLKAGGICFISMYGINRHPMWGADVEQFMPERWLDPSTLPENPNAFSTFGLGKRNCIGRLYSIMYMKTIVAHILRRYRVFSDLKSVQIQCDITIKPATEHQIRIQLRK